MAKNVLQSIAKSFVERATFLELKGKKRDNAALDYFVGAATALNLRKGNPDLQGAVFILSIRGYSEVLRWAEGS